MATSKQIQRLTKDMEEMWLSDDDFVIEGSSDEESGDEEMEEHVQKMREYLRLHSIPFTNEFSNARWVLRFKINIGKENHSNLLKSF